MNSLFFFPLTVAQGFSLAGKKKGSGFQMHCDLAQFKSWSDAQMDISRIERVGRGGGRGREEKREASEIKIK